jgi:hypothetical protein
MPIEVISNITSNASLQLKDEESLYEIISSKSKQNEDSRFFSLFEYVRFEYLSTKSIESFIEISNESFDFLHFRFGDHFVIDFHYLFRLKVRLIDFIRNFHQLFVDLIQIRISMELFQILRNDLEVM